ncbi:MAG: hypothetical protein ACW97A_02400 [Candidatus Thorarchaeota archaeon]|jgi:hypothetical protein
MAEDQLVLLFSAAAPDEQMHPLNEWSKERLWDLALNSNLHVVLREPHLLELARRNDVDIAEYCDLLLADDDHDLWFLGLKVLITLGTSAAIEILFAHFHVTGYIDGRTILQMVGKIVTSSHRAEFQKLAHTLAFPGYLEVSGWTSVALRALMNACEERGIAVVTRTSDGTTPYNISKLQSNSTQDRTSDVTIK